MPCSGERHPSQNLALNKMYTLTQQALSMMEAKTRFGGVLDLQLPNVEFPSTCVPGVEVLLPSPTDTDVEAISTLFIWVEGASVDDLRQLAAMPLLEENAETANLLERESFAILGDREGGIYIPMWRTDALRIGPGRQTLRFVLIGNDHVMDVRHHFTGEHLEDFSLNAQAQMSDSGPNYSCERDNSEEMLNEAAHLGYEYSLLGRRVVLLRAAEKQ